MTNMLVPKRLPIRYFPDAILHQKCAPVSEVTEDVKQLASDMLLTMMQYRGLGLAAPQVGVPIRLFVVDVEWPDGVENSTSYVFINPTLRLLEPTVKSVEGCISFPGERFELTRASRIEVDALDLDGKPFTLEAEGLLAVAIQHEYDHLEGKTGAESLSWLKRNLLRKKVEKLTKSNVR